MTTMTFGKHRGTDLNDMDPGYLSWMLKTADGSGGALDDFVSCHGDEMREAIASAGKRSAQAFKVEYTLNPSQSEAVDTIERQLLKGDENLFRLEGGAGYGKSFTVMEVVRRALLAGYNVRACATSYVATQVLAKQLNVIGVEAKTIASTIRLAKVELEDQEEYIMTGDTQDSMQHLLAENNLLIVDEYSMVSDDIADAMMANACAEGGKLLCVGDLHQLPPVKQNADSSFSRIPGSVTLTEPMRYNPSSDLFALEQLARMDVQGFHRADWTDSTEVITHGSYDELLAAYCSDMIDNPTEDLRMLFFRRADAFGANDTIRNILHGKDIAQANPIVDDERLMVMGTTDIARPGFDEQGNPNKQRFYSGTTYLVEDVYKITHLGIPCYCVTLDGVEQPVFVIFDSGSTVNDMRGTREYMDRLNELRDEALETRDWKPFYAFKAEFLSVGYNYAMTVHRAQGQTVDRVYFHPGMLNAGGMTDKLLYVAATRAKKAAHMVLRWSHRRRS